MSNFEFSLLVIVATVAVVWAINRSRMKTALRMRDAKIPVCRDDCFQGYEDVIKVLMQRLDSIMGNVDHATVMKCLGFMEYHDMRAFYPAIALIRLCHLTGFEVEFRNMRTENSPVEEGEIVSRMKRDEIK